MKRSALPRRTPLRRRAPLRARAAMPPVEGPRVKPRPRRRGRSTAFLVARAASFGVSAGRCVVCGVEASHGHHRKRRSQGGPDTAENVLPVCGPCHWRIHGPDAVLARSAGWLLRSTDPIGPWWELPFWTDRRAA